MSCGLFIVLEGGDYSGKGEQSKRLHNYFLEMSEDNIVVTLHQPTRYAGEIKRKLREDKDAFADGGRMAELYVEDREYISRKVITPVLEAGSIVICNRHSMSTCNYQRLQGVQLEKLLAMHRSRKIPTPDITFLLDISNEEGSRRMLGLPESPDKFEKDDIFRGRVYAGYRELAAMAKNDTDLFGCVEVINGNNPPGQVFDDIKRFLNPLYVRMMEHSA